MTKDTVIWILGGLASIVIIGSGVWYYYGKMSASKTYPIYSNTNTSIDVLLNKNSDFAKAEELKSAGDNAGAIASYLLALTKAKDAVQAGRIGLNLANATFLNGDTLGAVKLDKQVAADTKGLLRIRAYAVEDMGRMYYSTLDPSITSEIFKDEPYKSMFVPGDETLSYRKLFDYAISLSPLALSEMYSSNWYANNIRALQKNKTAANLSEIDADLAIIEAQFKAADADIALKKSDPSATQLIPAALLHKAMTIGSLSYAGLSVASSTDAEEVYKDSITAFSTYGPTSGNDGHARYQYALFLAISYGDKRTADVQALLKPLYTNPNYANVKTFFKNARSRSDITKRNVQRKNVQRLALLDPGFKTYLISLGWEESDF